MLNKGRNNGGDEGDFSLFVSPLKQERGRFLVSLKKGGGKISHEIKNIARVASFRVSPWNGGPCRFL